MSHRRQFLGRVAVASTALVNPATVSLARASQRPAGPAPGPGLTFNDAVAGAIAGARRTNPRFPGMVAAIVRTDRLLGIAAEGVRKLGSPERVEVTDRFHIGSNTKAMTATMIGAVIDSGRLRWDSTLGSVFPDVAGSMHPAYRGVTLDLLLEHQAGLPANIDWWRVPQGLTPTMQRRSILATTLGQPPRTSPGSKYEYSNVGYVLAGLMAEEVTLTPWEALMARVVFGPLGMTSATFGPPGLDRGAGQPWGHKPMGPVLVPDRSDNPSVMGPAGTVSVAVGDWAKFASFHLGDGTIAGRRILSPETFKELHTPAPRQSYAGGWLISNRIRRGFGPVWEHAGSNTVWYAIIRLYPREGFGVLTACNAGGPIGEAACTQVADALQVLEPNTRG